MGLLQCTKGDWLMVPQEHTVSSPSLANHANQSGKGHVLYGSAYKHSYFCSAGLFNLHLSDHVTVKCHKINKQNRSMNVQSCLPSMQHFWCEEEAVL